MPMSDAIINSVNFGKLDRLQKFLKTERNVNKIVLESEKLKSLAKLKGIFICFDIFNSNYFVFVGKNEIVIWHNF